MVFGDEIDSSESRAEGAIRLLAVDWRGTGDFTPIHNRCFDFAVQHEPNVEWSLLELPGVDLFEGHSFDSRRPDCGRRHMLLSCRLYFGLDVVSEPSL